ncbi:4'-phosphopantetheinyl transferase superfamily protein [bacterium]|nr:4'-phosphopantetheinyl transferase superfamily protein [bacterium]
MICGIGVDSTEIARVARKCREGSDAACLAEAGAAYPSRFQEKMFTQHEVQRSLSNQHAPYAHLAACFAAREAFFKATQVWYRRRKVSIRQYPSGEPYFLLHPLIVEGLAQRYAQVWGQAPADPRLINLRVSLTHDDTYCTAFAVLELLRELPLDYAGYPGWAIDKA